MRKFKKPEWIWTFFATFFPLLLLLPLRARFFCDWHNHLWLINYFGAYFHNTGQFPSVINTLDWTGLPYPVFYGYAFYPIAGILSSVLSADLVLRLILFLVVFLQYTLLRNALTATGLPIKYSRIVALLTNFSTYALTNLYNRGAIPEFIAVGFLTCGISLLISAFHPRHPPHQLRKVFASGLFFTLAAGTHPITCLASIPMLLLVVVLILLGPQRPTFKQCAMLGIPALLGLLVLAPWVYACLKFNSLLQMHQILEGIVYYFDRIDTWYTRLAPLPIDPDTFFIAPPRVDTPFLTAQTNVSLALFVGALVVAVWRTPIQTQATRKKLKVLLSLMASIWVFLIWITLTRDFTNLFPGVFLIIQFAYRMVSYQNITLILVGFLLGQYWPKQGVRIRSTWPAVCITLAACGVFIKLTHVIPVVEFRGSKSVFQDDRARETYLVTEPHMGPANAVYSTPSIAEKLPKGAVAQEVLLGAKASPIYGSPEPQSFHLSKETWISTSLLVFPWNQLILNGRETTVDEWRITDKYRAALSLPEGDHTLSYRSAPDSNWILLDRISKTVLFSWIGLTILGLFLSLFKYCRAYSRPY